jgi:AmiR/NasT family two-component response regulator
LQATLRETRVLRQLARETIARSRAARARVQSGRSQREILHHSAFARLAAKHETMAVIEQAKGIIMAQQRCGPEEAFDLLRQASQRTNIKVKLLAAQIVEHIAASDNDDTVTPITLGATQYPRLGTRA